MTKMELAKKLTETMDSRNKFKQLVGNLGKILPPSAPGSADLKSKVMELLDQCIEDLLDANAKVYSEMFSEEELQSLIDLHSSPAMIKFNDSQGEIAKRMDYYTKAVIMKHTAQAAFDQGYSEEPRQSSPLGGFGLLPTDIDDKNLN